MTLLVMLAVTVMDHVRVLLPPLPLFWRGPVGRVFHDLKGSTEG